jgi:hypothetical protein
MRFKLTPILATFVSGMSAGVAAAADQSDKDGSTVTEPAAQKPGRASDTQRQELQRGGAHGDHETGKPVHSAGDNAASEPGRSGDSPESVGAPVRSEGAEMSSVPGRKGEKD